MYTKDCEAIQTFPNAWTLYTLLCTPMLCWRCNTCVSTDRWWAHPDLGTMKSNHCWLVVTGTMEFYASWRTHIFQRGRYTTNQDMFLKSQCCSHLHRVKLQLDTQHISTFWLSQGPKVCGMEWNWTNTEKTAAAATLQSRLGEIFRGEWEENGTGPTLW